MNWLIWKDYRVNRLIFIVGALLMIVPHGLATISALRGWGPPSSGWERNFAISGLYSLVMLQVTLALIGGNAIAGERIDRSAEFLTYLPVSRGRKLASKLAVAAGLFSLVWLPNLIIVIIASATAGSLSGGPLGLRNIQDAWIVLGPILITGLTFFCVAWLLSSILDSPTFSVCGGLMVPFLVLMGVTWTAQYLGWSTRNEMISLWYGRICLVLAAASFPAGIVYYLRRVEP